MAETAAAVLEFSPVETPAGAPVRRWSLPTRLVFRFLTIYFTLYVFATQMLGGLLTFEFPSIESLPPISWMVQWTAKNVIGVTGELVTRTTGSGDRTVDYALVFCLLAIAVAGTVAWSLIARGRANHETAFKWFRLFLRFALGSTMLSYGAAKFIPLQMPFPGLQRLVEPYGHLSPMGVLWASIGASPAYEVFTGVVEAGAAVLLFIPGLTTIGALLSLASTTEIFVLNMTYDVPVKLFSFHLVLMSLYLLAPEARRLLNVLVLNRGSGPSTVPSLTDKPGAARLLAIGQLVFAAYLVGSNIDGSIKAWSQYGGGAPKSPLYGLWNVSYMSIDGVERAALVTDTDRWRRVIFDRPANMSFQRMDDTFAGFANKIDMTAKTIGLTKAADPKWSASFTIEQLDKDHMNLTGDMDGRQIHMKLELVSRDKFLLVSRGFNWIQEFPFNR